MRSPQVSLKVSRESVVPEGVWGLSTFRVQREGQALDRRMDLVPVSKPKHMHQEAFTLPLLESAGRQLSGCPDLG